LENLDIHSSERKADHIRMALESQVKNGDDRFYYEPLLAGHPQDNEALKPISFCGKQLYAPIWISSMTGGTALAGDINKRLATACGKFGLGMGLGSCRMLLEDDTYLSDFQLRPFVGDDHPIFANLGIAQVEDLLDSGKQSLIDDLIAKTETDGLIIHVNPLQEWLQPEGDRIVNSPIETISRLLEKCDYKIIVKEVGQGMGPSSLAALCELPLAAIDFAALGGTNFARMEMGRSADVHDTYKSISHLGHTMDEMIGYYNSLIQNETKNCPPVILSGGIKSFLDGYYAINKLKGPAIYGQASVFLTKALEGQEVVEEYISREIEGLKLAQSFLRVK